MSDAPFDLVDAKDSFMDTDWFHTCRKTQTPYIVIRSGESAADVLWDFVTLPPSCDSKLHAELAVLEHNARAIFNRFAVKDSYLRIKPTMICFDHLPLERAKEAALELYDLIASFLPSRPSSEQGDAPRALVTNKVHRISRSQLDVAEDERQPWVESNRPASSAA